MYGFKREMTGGMCFKLCNFVFLHLKQHSMKKLLTAAIIATVFMAACNETKTTETTTTPTDTTATEINDATEAQKLADPNSNYSPDSLK